MTKAYSKISGYDRRHVYVFVSDKKISPLESVFKNFRIQPENTLDTSRIRKKNWRFHRFPDTCGQGLNLENGEIISDMKQINQEVELFYSDLLKTKSSGFLSTNFRDNFFTFVEDLDIPKLSLEESVSIESDLTLGEIKKRFNILSE